MRIKSLLGIFGVLLISPSIGQAQSETLQDCMRDVGDPAYCSALFCSYPYQMIELISYAFGPGAPVCATDPVASDIIRPICYVQPWGYEVRSYTCYLIPGAEPPPIPPGPPPVAPPGPPEPGGMIPAPPPGPGDLALH